MASTGFRARVIFSEFEGNVTDEIDFTGSYKLLVKAKSIPAPVGAPNTVESTTLEDDAQTFEMGIKTSDSKEVTGNLEKEYLQAINKLAGKKVKIIQLYGTDVIATPSEVGGTDEILEMSATIIPNSVATDVTEKLTVADDGSGTFTVTKAG